MYLILVIFMLSGCSRHLPPVSQEYIDINREACERGDMIGCGELGAIYNLGNGVRQNYQIANELYNRACNGGDEQSCTLLGFQYYFGNGVRQNYSVAKELFGQACDMGDNSGCKQYSYLYQEGY
jgi:TPR repeat protein